MQEARVINDYVLVCTRLNCPPNTSFWRKQWTPCPSNLKVEQEFRGQTPHTHLTLMQASKVMQSHNAILPISRFDTSPYATITPHAYTVCVLKWVLRRGWDSCGLVTFWTFVDPKGNLLQAPQLIRAISKDAVLSKVKLIAEPWDIGAYQVGQFPNWDIWAEWNGQYRDIVRRFIKGDPGLKANFATKLSGSADLYHNHNRYARFFHQELFLQLKSIHMLI